MKKPDSCGKLIIRHFGFTKRSARDTYFYLNTNLHLLIEFLSFFFFSLPRFLRLKSWAPQRLKVLWKSKMKKIKKHICGFVHCCRRNNGEEYIWDVAFFAASSVMLSADPHLPVSLTFLSALVMLVHLLKMAPHPTDLEWLEEARLAWWNMKNMAQCKTWKSTITLLWTSCYVKHERAYTCSICTQETAFSFLANWGGNIYLVYREWKP